MIEGGCVGGKQGQGGRTFTAKRMEDGYSLRVYTHAFYDGLSEDRSEVFEMTGPQWRKLVEVAHASNLVGWKPKPASRVSHCVECFAGFDDVRADRCGPIEGDDRTVPLRNALEATAFEAGWNRRRSVAVP